VYLNKNNGRYRQAGSEQTLAAMDLKELQAMPQKQNGRAAKGQGTKEINRGNAEYGRPPFDNSRRMSHQ
jgi:hypothetical protein